jgi:hypothetical protein
MSRHSITALTALTALTVLTVSLAGCTSTTSGNNVSTPGASSASSSSTDLTPTGSPSTATLPATDTPTASASPTHSRSPATAAQPPLPKGTCIGSQLTVRVLRGGALPGREIALVTFTNSSTAPCTMFGFPGVSLRLQNALLAMPAQRTSDSPATVRLAPGEQGQAQITDNSSCQAPLSDTVRVYPPNLVTFVDVTPFQLRGCSLTVAPVTHS